jgi:hypothetical protein
VGFRAVSVPTTVVQLASYNPRRTAIVIINNGTATVYISDNQADVSTQGFPLASGASFSLIKADGDDPTVALYGVASTGTQDIRVAESWA